MKPRTKAFADALLADPSKSQTQAYIETHQTNKQKTAVVEASKLIRKPNVRIYMKKHEDKAKKRVYELLDSSKEDIVLKAASDILDRNLGKAVQRAQTENRNINLNLEGSQELSDDFTAYLKAKTTHVEPF